MSEESINEIMNNPYYINKREWAEKVRAKKSWTEEELKNLCYDEMKAIWDERFGLELNLSVRTGSNSTKWLYLAAGGTEKKWDANIKRMQARLKALPRIEWD